jgi:hypothetical protein
MMKKLVAIFALLIFTCAVSPASAVTLQFSPKIGACYLFTEKELNGLSPITNPVSCSKPHNAETFWIAKWTKKATPYSYTEDALRDNAEKACVVNWEYPEDSDLNYWGYFLPNKTQWKKGARWIRCDAMSQLSEDGAFEDRFATWSGSAGSGSGFGV